MNEKQARWLLDISAATPLSQATLKRAWKRAALKTHPDRGGDAEAFLAVAEAAQVLQRLIGGGPSVEVRVGSSGVGVRPMLAGPAPRQRARLHPSGRYLAEQAELESLYGSLGEYGRDGLLRAYYQIMRGEL
jgi:hypothetical protein